MLEPNPVADLYDSLCTMLDVLPAETHPAWELAIESVLFGGEGITPDIIPYGEQQAERNNFKISTYRTHYGNGERVTEFPTLSTKPPRESDRQYIDEEIRLPVSPESGAVLPLFVDDESLSEAVRLLNAFPTKPGAETNESNNSNLLNPDRFPGLTELAPDYTATDDGLDTGQSPDDQAEIPPNELADLYDGLYTALESLPNDTDRRWQEAIESVLFGGEYLKSEASPYGEQQAERNNFRMPDYRSKFGDGSRVTEFPTIETTHPDGENAQHVEPGVELPITPDTQRVLPLAPAEEDLTNAAQLLAEFPGLPDAETGKREDNSLFDTDTFASDITPSAQTDTTESSPGLQSELESNSEAESPSSHSETKNRNTRSQSPSTTETEGEIDGNTRGSPSTDSTILRQESAGESPAPIDQQDRSSSQDPKKYHDPQAERAHRRAQQRDPSDVVELGDEIRLTLKQVDYSSRPPTIMGTKNRLVVFVIDAPQDLSEYETIKATVVDYGGKNNSAEAAFSGYVD